MFDFAAKNRLYEAKFNFIYFCFIAQYPIMQGKQAGAELGQAQVPTVIWLYCD